MTFPRVLGIEAVGVVDAAPGTDLQVGQQVATLMGGMGRTFDGGYAEYTVVPRRQVIPFHSDLPWNVIGAVPETRQTASGSLTVGLDLQRGQSFAHSWRHVVGRPRRGRDHKGPRRDGAVHDATA